MQFMNSIAGLTSQQLHRAADILERVESLQGQLEQLLGAPAQATVAEPTGRRTRKFSAQALANIRAGARRRWAREQGAEKATEPAQKRKRKISAAHRAALSAAAKRRWVKAKQAGKTTL